MKGWVGLVGWPVADGLLTLVVTHQLQVERRTGKVRRPKTDALTTEPRHVVKVSFKMNSYVRLWLLDVHKIILWSLWRCANMLLLAYIPRTCIAEFCGSAFANKRVCRLPIADFYCVNSEWTKCPRGVYAYMQMTATAGPQFVYCRHTAVCINRPNCE